MLVSPPRMLAAKISTMIEDPVSMPAGSHRTYNDPALAAKAPARNHDATYTLSTFMPSILANEAFSTEARIATPKLDVESRSKSTKVMPTRRRGDEKNRPDKPPK